jgi:alpha-tubulin suppressor-like RCC1 family protein
MLTRPWMLLAALASAAFISAPAAAGREDFKPGYPPPEKNLAVEFDAPGVVRAQIAIAIPSLREDLRYELGTDEHGLVTGGIYVPPGDEARVEVVAFDARGEAIYKGAGIAFVDKELTPEFQVPLEGQKFDGSPPQVRFGSNLLTAGIVGEVDDLLRVQLTLVDPYGTRLPYTPDDFEWRLPKDFPEIKYSCFNGQLCILEWKPTLEQQTIYLCLKLKPWPCITTPPQDYRGPYKSVAVGRNHTCAITRDDDVRCWGDNLRGQLGAPTTALCFGMACSPDPIPVTCPANAVCKFKALAAGGDHTCAVDTRGKAWCWGQDGSEAVGEPWFGSQPDFTHREVPAGTPLGAVVFDSIDTNFAHTCALSSTQDVFCWGANFSGELGTPPSFLANTTKATMIVNGNKYKSIATGSFHSCAIQTNGLLDCWGDNKNFQLTGNTNSSTFITVNPMIPMLTGRSVRRVAAGAVSTCAESSANNVICWGKPALSAPASTASNGYVALYASSSTSLATDSEDCVGGTMNCAQHCVTDNSGELHCGWWVSVPGNPPGGAQLSKVNKPWTDFGVDWVQTDVGPNHVCTLTSERDIWCCGKNDHGQFGTGTFANSVIDTTRPATRAKR